MTLNPITALRAKRARSRKASLMPVSQKPRMKFKDRDTAGRGPNLFTAAGKLLYGFYEFAASRRGQYAQATVDKMLRAEDRAEKLKPRKTSTRIQLGRRTRHNSVVVMGHVMAAPADRAGSRPAERRRRQQAHLNQHPSVVARFANHPTQAQIEAALA